MQKTPRFVDEHRTTITAPRDRVWEAVNEYCGQSLTKDRDNPLVRLLGTEPRAGFAISREVPGRQLDLDGRHRFARYRLVFELRDGEGETTELIARTFADFPGPHGFVYKTLVIGSRGHVLAIRGILRSINRLSSVG